MTDWQTIFLIGLAGFVVASVGLIWWANGRGGGWDD